MRKSLKKPLSLKRLISTDKLREHIKAGELWINGHERSTTTVLIATIVLSYFLYNLRFPGPVYLADEIGYLTKAAAIGGNVIDAFSSFHAGYSLFISPAFMLFDDAVSAWRAVMFINAVLWGGTFYFLLKLLKKLFPKYPNSNHATMLFVTAACALYPSWITMSGYAFSTTGFIFILTGSLLLLADADKSGMKAAMFGVVAGFLYWVHPFAAIYIAAVTAIMFLRAISTRKWRFLFLSILPMLFTVILYSYGVRPVLQHLMTPEFELIWNHYDASSTTDKIMNQVRYPSFWGYMVSVFLGQASQLVIASFGVVVYAFFVIRLTVRKLTFGRLVNTVLRDNLSAITVIVGLSLLGALFISTVTSVAGRVFPQSPVGGMHFWLYARYSEMYVLPLLALGLVNFKKTFKRNKTSVIVLATLISGYLVQIGIDRNMPRQFFNFTMSPSFWPMMTYTEVRFLVWFLLGATAIFMVGLLSQKLGRPALLLALPLVLVSINYQSNYHVRQYRYTPASGLTEAISSAYGDSTCIGYEYERDVTMTRSVNDRIRLTVYENFSHGPQRMTLEEWLFTPDCDGPFITPVIYDDWKLRGAAYMSKEETSSTLLYMIARPEDADRFGRDIFR